MKAAFLTLVITCVFLCALSGNACAEKPTGGVKAGLTLGKVDVDYLYVGSTDFKTGLSVGGFLNFKRSRYFEIQPEASFIMKGANYNGRLPFIGEGENSATMNYLEIPVLAKFKLLSKRQVVPFVVAGPALGVLFSAKVKAKKGEITEEYDLGQDTNVFDLGIVLGIGGDISLKSRSISLECRYSIGLTNINGSDLDGSAKNRALSFLVGLGL